MTTFFYYLSVYDISSYSWRNTHYDVIESADKKSAIKELENLYSKKIVQKAPRDLDALDSMFKIFIVELTDYWRDHWLKERVCNRCLIPYTLLQANHLNSGANHEFCSSNCRNEGRVRYVSEFKEGEHNPVIYKITYKPTGQCYIGQTTQAFTLRWYQHFFQTSKTKFHRFIEQSKLEDWTFEVLETLQKEVSKDEINERERLSIIRFNSKQDGFNSVNFNEKLPEEEIKGIDDD